ARPVVPQRVEHDLADRLAGLPRQQACELRGLGIADVHLILHQLFLRKRECRWVPVYSTPGRAAINRSCPSPAPECGRRGSSPPCGGGGDPGPDPGEPEGAETAARCAAHT